MRPFAIGPKTVSFYSGRSERTVRRMCARREIKAELVGGDWAISIEGLKHKFWRLGRDTWKRICYDFYKDKSDAEEAYMEFISIEEQERELEQSKRKRPASEGRPKGDIR